MANEAAHSRNGRCGGTPYSTPKITLKYIGINKEEKSNVLDKFQI